MPPLDVWVTNCAGRVHIEQLILQDVNPPNPVKPAFNEVNEAQQERERLINEAQSEYNRVIPRAAGEAQQVIAQAEGYFADFRARATPDWDHSVLDRCEPLAASPDKVHLDVVFSRLRADGRCIETFRSLWVVTRLDGRWGAQLRSSFAR